MHTHPNKYICIEKLNGTLYNSSVWADEKEVMQENLKKPVLLYQIKTLAKSGKVIRQIGASIVSHARISRECRTHSFEKSNQRKHRFLSLCVAGGR